MVCPLTALLGLASELLGDKYHLPKPRYPDTALARHERSVFLEAKEKIVSLGGYQHHRGEEFNRCILPRCRSLIEAVGHRMAYEAARDAEVPPEVLRLFENLSIENDLSWYVENGLLTRAGFFDTLAEAYHAAVPVLLRQRQTSELDAYITAPIITSQAWDRFHGELQVFEHPDARQGYRTNL